MTATATAINATESKTRTHERNEARQASRPVATPQTSIVEVTPVMAAFFVEKNLRNRSIRPNVVNAYARVMASGGWKLTGEALKFDTEGNLIDGQHRLLAIIKSDTPVQLTIVRGLDSEAQSVMDSGAKRTAQDHFLLAGVKNAAVVSAIARLQERLLGHKSTTNAEMIAWVEQHSQIHAAAEMAVTYRNSIDLHPSVLGVAWMNLSTIDLAKAEEFFDSISSHRTDGQGDPRSALIRRLTSARRVKERLTQEAQLSLVYRAWNSWINGEQLFRIPVESRVGNVKIPDPVAFGTRVKSARRTKPVVVDVTAEDYEAFPWPQAPEAKTQEEDDVE